MEDVIAVPSNGPKAASKTDQLPRASEYTRGSQKGQLDEHWKPGLGVSEPHRSGNPSARSACPRTLPSLSRPLITTLPTLTEAMYFLGKQFGWRGQIPLWEMIRQEKLEVLPIDDELLHRMDVLMEEYSDTPMDFADASLVALAEQKKLTRIFTVDEHFRVYMLFGREPFDIVPGRA